MNNKKIVQKAGSRVLAVVLSAAMSMSGTAGGSLLTGAIVAKAGTVNIKEDFEADPAGYLRSDGTGSLTVSEEGKTGKAALVSNRAQGWFTYAYNVEKFAGGKAKISVQMKTTDSQIVCEVTGAGDDGKAYYNWLLNKNVTAGEWTELSGEVEIPEGAKELYFSTGSGTADYLIDDVNITFIEAGTIITNIDEDFEAEERAGYLRSDGTGSLTVSEEGKTGKAALVSNRAQGWFTYAYNVEKFAGAKAKISAQMKTTDSQIVCEVTGAGDDGKAYYNWLLNKNVTAGEWTELSGEVEIPEGAKELYFSTGSGTADYLIDDVHIEFEQEEAPAANLTAKADYTFDKLELALGSAEETGGAAEMKDGKLVVTLTKQYGQVFFKLPAELDKEIVKSITLNVTEGSGSSGLSPKILTQGDFETDNRGGDVGVAYGTNSVSASSDELGKNARYLGIMTTSDCSAEAPVVITFDSVTITSKSSERIINADKDVMKGLNGNFEGKNMWNDASWGQNKVSYVAYSNDDKAPNKDNKKTFMRTSVSANEIPTIQQNTDKDGVVKSDKGYEFAFWARLSGDTEVADPTVDLEVVAHNAWGDDANTAGATIKYDDGNVITKDWKKISGTMILPATAEETQGTKVGFTGKAGTNFDIDNLQIAEMRLPKVDMNIPSLADAVKKQDGSRVEFMGTCLPASQLDNANTMKLVEKHFNSVTGENEMKPESILGSSAPGVSTLDELAGKLNFAQGDALADYFANYNKTHAENPIKMRGHVFVWHSQTPTWWFREGFKADGKYVSKEEMNKRIDWYIQQVATHYDNKYPGLIYAWDVVNEQASDAGGIRMGTDWAAVYGGSTEYILQAFKSADKYVAKDTILFYNDYNDCDPTKAATIRGFLKEIRTVLSKDRKLGAGMQGHHDMLTPTYETIEAAMRGYAEIADVVHITELDVKSSVGFRDTDEAAMETEFTKQGHRYKDIYEIVRKVNADTSLKGYVQSIVIWGTYDPVSWLKTSNSVGGSADGKTPQYPLLFDDYYGAKPAYWAFIDASKLEPLVRDVNAMQTDKFDYANAIQYYADKDAVTVKPIWNANTLKLQVAVASDKAEAVTVYVDPTMKNDASKFIKKTATEFKTVDGKAVAEIEIPLELKALDKVSFDVVATVDGKTYSYNDTTNNQDKSSKYYAVVTMKPFMAITNGAAVIDGDISEWKDIPAASLDVKGDSPKATATTKVAWDNDNLYVMLDVTDDVLDDSARDEYQQDSTEIFIDELNEKAGSFDDNDKQYRVSYTNKQSFNGQTCKPENIKSATKVKEDGTGYVIETAIKWTALKPEAGKLIGFDAQINDGANGSRVGTLNWYDASGNGYQNPSVYGTAVLADPVAVENKKAVDTINTMIKNLETVTDTEDCQKVVDYILSKYNELSFTDKAAVSGMGSKVDALAAAKEASGKAIDDTKTAIKAIGTVSASSKTKIDAARKAYNALTDEQKAKITAAELKVLTDAEAAYQKVTAPTTNPTPAPATKIATKKVTVKNAKTGKTVKSVKLKKGQKLQLKVTTTPSKTTDKITFKTSKKSVATVSKKGLVKAKKAGKATITVKSGKKTAKVKVTVIKK